MFFICFTFKCSLQFLSLWYTYNVHHGYKNWSASKNDLENVTNDKRFLTENEESCTKQHYICKLHLNLTQDMNKSYSSDDIELNSWLNVAIW